MIAYVRDRETFRTMIAYAMPMMTGRKLWDNGASIYGFWISNIGMVAMTCAFAVAGISQVVLERRLGMDFMVVQHELAPHFIGLVLAAVLFTFGIALFIWNFFRHGLPRDEMIGIDPAEGLTHD